ncbi:caspase-1-A-like isoform X2 [Artemia franciscana]|uniref:Caspase family p20 domain-containing protein n=1 Tax=Artemia franciscana TaxID=6661 RepID=A0AA88I170_ARTSF|nr:hypothetical protein QYM36_010725 [Artemia franciscana]
MDAIPIGFKESIPLAGSTGIGTAESKHEEREQYSLVGSGRGLSPDEFVVEKSSREFYEKNNKKIEKCYPVDLSKKRGQVLIINMNTFDNGSPRQGSERDVLNLKRLFEELNFIVTVECNLSKKELKDVIDLFSRDREHKEYSCCFIFLLSHGAPMRPLVSHPYSSGSIGVQWGIVCRDGNTIDVEEDFISKFSNREATYLIGKPRFIIINACRICFTPRFIEGDVVH